MAAGSSDSCSTTTPVAPVDDDLGHRAVGQGDHRRAARHRLDHHHAERLVPEDGEEQAACPGEQPALLRCVGVADVDRVRPEPRRDLGLVELLLGRLGALAGEEDPDPGRARRVDREVRALGLVEPPEEEDVVVLAVAEREARTRRCALWTVPTQFRSAAERRWFSEIATSDDVAAERSVDVGQLVHRAVHRDDGGHPPAAGQQWTGQGVVVDDVVVGAGPDAGPRRGRC